MIVGSTLGYVKYLLGDLLGAQHQGATLNGTRKWKVTASDFRTALATWDDFDARMLGYHDQQYFW